VVVAMGMMVDAILTFCGVQEDHGMKMAIAACQRGLPVSELQRDRKRSNEISTDAVLLCR